MLSRVSLPRTIPQSESVSTYIRLNIATADMVSHLLILSSHSIGLSALSPADQPMGVPLGRQRNRYHGRLLPQWRQSGHQNERYGWWWHKHEGGTSDVPGDWDGRGLEGAAERAVLHALARGSVSREQGPSALRPLKKPQVCMSRSRLRFYAPYHRDMNLSL